MINPQDLQVTEKTLAAIAEAFKTGGITLLAAVFLFFGWKIVVAITRMSKNDKGAVSVQIGESRPAAGNGQPKGPWCGVHNAVERFMGESARDREGIHQVLEEMKKESADAKKENSEQHARIFGKLDLIVERLPAKGGRGE